MSDSENQPVDWRPDARAVADKIRPIIERVENVRKMALERRAKAIRRGATVVGASAALALMAALAENGVPIATMIIVLGLIADIITYAITDSGTIKAYRSIYKREVLAKATAEIAPSMAYPPESMVPQNLFKAGGLFDSRIDRYTGEDYFKGRAGVTELLFSELHVEWKENAGRRRKPRAPWQSRIRAGIQSDIQ